MYEEMNEYNNSKDQSKISFASLPAIDSILSINDTVLRDIENDNDNNEMPSGSPKIHERTLNDLALESSICDMLELHENFEIESATNTSNNKDSNQWQDETFMNHAFTQLDSSDGKGDAFKCPSQVI